MLGRTTSTDYTQPPFHNTRKHCTGKQAGVAPRMRAAACRRLLLASRSSSASFRSRRLLLSTTKTSSHAALASAAAPHAIWLPMPRLAPHMTTGRVHAWLKSEGGTVVCYEVLAELASDNLVEGAHRVGRFEGEVTLLLEAQEEGVLARVLRPAGPELVGVGAPIAVLCEEEDEVEATVQGLASLPPHVLSTLDLYDEEAQRLLRVCTWQAYLKGPAPS